MGIKFTRYNAITDTFGVLALSISGVACGISDEGISEGEGKGSSDRDVMKNKSKQEMTM